MAATSYSDIWNAITSRLEANWATTAIHWPGTDFKPPIDGSAWIQPRLRWLNARQVTIGVAGLNRIDGVFFVTVLTPIGAGVDEAVTHADTIRNLYPRGLRLAAGAEFIIFRVPEVETGIEGEQWHQLEVNAPFYMDEDN